MLHHFYLIEFNQYYLAKCEYQFQKLVNVELTTKFEYARCFETIDKAIEYLDEIGFGYTVEYGIVKVVEDEENERVE